MSRNGRTLTGPDPLPLATITASMCVTRSNFATYSFAAASADSHLRAMAAMGGGVPSPSDAWKSTFCSALNGSSGCVVMISSTAATMCCLSASAYWISAMILVEPQSALRCHVEGGHNTLLKTHQRGLS